MSLLAIGFTLLAWASLGISWMILRQNRKLIKLMRTQTQAQIQTTAVACALVHRLSPHGHVDLADEELRIARTIQMIPWENGLRVLVD